MVLNGISVSILFLDRDSLYQDLASLEIAGEQRLFQELGLWLLLVLAEFIQEHLNHIPVVLLSLNRVIQSLRNLVFVELVELQHLFDYAYVACHNNVD